MEPSASPTKHQQDELQQWKELIMDMDYHCGDAFYSKPLKSGVKDSRHSPAVPSCVATADAEFVLMKDISTTDTLFSHLNSQNVERLSRLLKERSMEGDAVESSPGRGVKRRSDMMDVPDNVRTY